MELQLILELMARTLDGAVDASFPPPPNLGIDRRKRISEKIAKTHTKKSILYNYECIKKYQALNFFYTLFPYF